MPYPYRKNPGKAAVFIGWIVFLAALVFMGVLIYHSRLEVSARGNLGDENRINVTAVLLGGILKIKCAALIERDKTGRLRLRLTVNDKPIRLQKILSGKPSAQKPKPSKPKQKRRFILPSAVQRYAIKHISLRSFGLSMTIGVFSDAAITAQLCGLALTTLETASGVLRSLKPEARVLMRVSANYTQDCLKLRLSCILGAKIGHVINIAAMLAAHHAKGAFIKWLIQSKTLCAQQWKTSRT